MNIAIFTPDQNSYSETFIQAHKKYLAGDVFYYYGTGKSIRLENKSNLISTFKRKWLLLKSKLLRKHSLYVWNQILLNSIQKNKIDVILVEYGTHAYNLRKILKTFNLPIVVHFHGFDASVYKVVERCNNYKEVFELATKVIAVSKKMEHMLLDLNCPREKLVYNVYGPQSKFVDIKPKFTKKQFIAIGRLIDKKAPYYTILAFKEVIKIHPDAKLLIAGDGLLMNACKNLIQHYQLAKHIKLLGVVTQESYRELLLESLAFVQHSIIAEDGDMEGTPVAILEASIAGLPVIATKHAGIPDVILHESTGLLVDEHDVYTMSKYMLQLLDDVEYAKQLGAAGKLHIKEHFSLERHITTLQKVLDSSFRRK